VPVASQKSFSVLLRNQCRLSKRPWPVALQSYIWNTASGTACFGCLRNKKTLFRIQKKSNLTYIQTIPLKHKCNVIGHTMFGWCLFMGKCPTIIGLKKMSCCILRNKRKGICNYLCSEVLYLIESVVDLLYPKVT
jgi:hypothetical protein